MVPDGGIATGLRALVMEAERVRTHGFAAAELDRTKREMLAHYERVWQERDKSESSSYAREYVSNFLTGEPSPGIDVELAMVRQFLPTITLDEVRDVIHRNIHEDSRVVLVVAPAKEGVTVPAAKTEVRSVLLGGHEAAIAPWEDRTAGRQLLEKPPAGGSVTARRKVDSLGVTVARLSNGVEVWLKPTDFGPTRSSSARTRWAGRRWPLPARGGGPALADRGGRDGRGRVRSVEIESLAGKLIQVSPEVQHYTHGVSGSRPRPPTWRPRSSSSISSSPRTTIGRKASRSCAAAWRRPSRIGRATPAPSTATPSWSSTRPVITSTGPSSRRTSPACGARRACASTVTTSQTRPISVSCSWAPSTWTPSSP